MRRAQQEVKTRSEELGAETKRVAARESRLEKMDADTELRHSQGTE